MLWLTMIQAQSMTLRGTPRAAAHLWQRTLRIGRLVICYSTSLMAQRTSSRSASIPITLGRESGAG
jgi:hypothetical protein